MMKRRTTCFIISDFLDKNYLDELKIANRKHDMVALQIIDEREMEMPNVGLVQFQDAESGHSQWFDSSLKSNRTLYKANALKMRAETQDSFKRSGVDFVELYTHRSFIQPLMNLFKRRGSRR